MKNILIIDGFPPPHKWLRNSNHHVTWLSYPEEIRPYEYHRIITIDSILENNIEIINVLHTQNPFDYIYCFRERSMELTYRLSEHLKVPSNSNHNISKINNKYEMRVFQENSSFKYAIINNYEDLKKGIIKTKYPAILKPIDGFASQNVYKINNESELQNNWINFSKDNKIGILEEFIFGKEYSIEVISINNIHKIIGITKKYKNQNFVEIGHSFPKVFPNLLEEKIKSFIVSLLDKLNVNDGISHTEIIITEHQDIQLIETHLRPPGDCIPILIKEALNFDIFDYFLTNTLIHNTHTDINIEPKNIHSAIWFKTSDVQGKVISIINQNDDNNMNFIEFHKFKNVNDFISPTSSSLDRLCYVISKGPTSKQAIDSCKDYLDKVFYILQTKDNKIVVV
ncbi:ATP-grasp domain-containing protein [Macrococcoides bohemicum]|uniref:ATP-grasp domain-containing protein n=1 Tax=Macrococcoides bohemicum TaxID=1903056 RepID=UPI001059CF5A|nr:ATP-grasp domain-containing protein [Macrococcus bohemicus]TDL33472.1 ATP-grasp domain-containing protein [Macrococcus bohemicus]